MYLNPLQASLFAYPHLYSSAVNPASLHLHNNGGSAGAGQHQQQHLVAGSGTGAEGHHQHHSPALDEYGHEMSNPTNPSGEPTEPTPIWTPATLKVKWALGKLADWAGQNTGLGLPPLLISSSVENLLIPTNS